MKATILTYRESEMVLRCAASLKDVARIELFFNGSDGVAETQIPNGYSVISEKQNLPFAEVVNRAIARAVDCDYLLFVTNDVIFSNGAVQQLIDTMENNPQIGLLGPLQLKPGSHEIHHAGGSFNYKRWKADVEGEDAIGKSGLMRRDWIDGAAMLIRFSSAKRVGEMRPEYGFYWEDVDWGIRFREAEFDVCVDLDATVTHENSSTTSQFGRWKQYLISRNRALAATLNLSGEELSRVKRYLRQSMMLRVLQYGFKEKSRVYWAGIRDGLAGNWQDMNQPIRDDDPIWQKVLRIP